MSRATVAAAKAEVYAQLSAASASFGSAEVFAYQPALAELTAGLGVCVFTVGVLPDFWQVAVRVIVTATVSPRDAQDALDVYMLAVDAALSARYGPSSWVVEFATEDAPYYSATNVLQVGREDY